MRGVYALGAVFSLVLTAFLAGCLQIGGGPGLPNPAAEYCEESGGVVELYEEGAGQAGYCRIGSLVCEEWEYYETNGSECTPPEYCHKGGSKMSLWEAKKIAGHSECLDNASLGENMVCNNYTGTWWLDLEIEKPGCSPACVVDAETGEAEINWRCTGLLPEEPCGVGQGCTEGKTCAKLPQETSAYCYEDPCAAAGCPTGTECALAESYPVQVFCMPTSG